MVVCVSADFKMAQGQELAMLKKFGNIPRLRSLNRSVTEIPHLTQEKYQYFILSQKNITGKSLPTKMHFKAS